MKRWVIQVSVAKPDGREFANQGTVETKCPFCDAEVVFEMKGVTIPCLDQGAERLGAKPTVLPLVQMSPTIDWKVVVGNKTE